MQTADSDTRLADNPSKPDSAHLPLGGERRTETTPIVDFAENSGEEKPWF